MATTVTSVEIPNRPVFRASEVCDLAQLQPYVLRTWEMEFPDLGVAKSAGSPRVYRRADVARVLRIKQLLFGEGLTIAGARRRLSEEGAAGSGEAVSDTDVAAMLDEHARASLREVKRGLQWVLSVLDGKGGETASFVLAAPAARTAAKKAPVKKVAAKSKKKR